jgi:putative endonuclease
MCYRYWVYILSSERTRILYIGVTNNLIRRIYEHKNHLFEGFSKKYNINRLVYSEEYSSIYDAICREKRLKAWKRDWKIKLIESQNPDWKDLYESLLR